MADLKKRAKLVLARTCGRAPLPGLWARMRQRLDPSGRCAILLYHRVVPRAGMNAVASLPGIVVTAESFEAQMRYLRANACVLTRDGFLAALELGRFPPRSVFITFDDGWEDNVRHAYPILKTQGLAATIFLTAGLVGTERAFWQERLMWRLRQASSRVEGLTRGFKEQGLEALLPQVGEAERRHWDGRSLQGLVQQLARETPEVIESLIQALDEGVPGTPFPFEQNRLMSWDQASSMEAGLITFGSHGMSHRPMPQCGVTELENELRGAKATLEARLGRVIDTLAYPGGAHDDRVVRSAAAAGYRAAFTLVPGLCAPARDALRLPRINLHEDRITDEHGVFSPELFAVRLEGWI